MRFVFGLILTALILAVADGCFSSRRRRTSRPSPGMDSFCFQIFFQNQRLLKRYDVNLFISFLTTEILNSEEGILNSSEEKAPFFQ